MSGYRTLHRVKEQDFPLTVVEGQESSSSSAPNTPAQPIWAVTFSPCAQSRPCHRNATTAIASPLRLLTSSADGFLRAYTLTDKCSNTNSNSMELDAAALKIQLTHVLIPSSTVTFPPPVVTADDDGDGTDDDGIGEEEDDGLITLGSAAISVIRNYVGEDANAGGEVVCSLRLDGYVSIWTREEQPLYANPTTTTTTATTTNKSSHIPIPVRPQQEFHVENAAGTTMVVLPPQLTGYDRGGTGGVGVVRMLVGCLDGSIVLLSTGIPIANPSATTSSSTTPTTGTAAAAPEPTTTPAGTILETIGSGNSVPTGITLHPLQPHAFAVGRKDGTVDLYTRTTSPSSSSSNSSYTTHSSPPPLRRSHRLTNHAGTPIRAIAYTPDGALLLTGSDKGHIYIHDTSSLFQNETVRMVSAIRGAHSSYVLSLGILPRGSGMNDGGDSRRFVSCGADGLVKVWDVVDSKDGGSAVHTFETGGGGGTGVVVWDVSCSGGREGGRRCVSCGEDGRLQVYACEEK